MKEILDIINEMSPYLLLGFFLAGLMHAFVPGHLYSRYLSRPSLRSVINAALLGIPLPLCSCGVIPTAMSLRREGASKGATTSFLIATPQTGVDSIIATWSLMGLPFAIVRPIAALVTALFGGQMVNIFDRDSKDEAMASAAAHPKHEHDHCHCGEDNCHCDEGCGGGCDCDATKVVRPASFGAKVAEALRYAFVDMMADIGKWLVIGLFVAGLITVFVPASFFEIFADNSLLSMLLVLCLAVPMYLCATGSIPIAVALMIKGLTPGAGLVMLMAGPASNVASILVIRKVLGRRTQLIYLASIIAGAVAFGLAIDHLLPREWFISSLVHTDACCHEETSLFSWICTGVLALLLVNALLVQPHLHKHAHHQHADLCHDDDRCHCDDCHCEGCGEDDDKDSMGASATTVLNVTGMNCNHCRAAVEKALASVEGVTAVSVDLQSGEAVVKGQVERDTLVAAIESVGFGVK